MVDLYPNYDETTASRIVRWHPSKLYAEIAIWDPPASFAGTPRPIYVFESGGARQARRDFRIGASETSPGVHTIPGMMTEELGAYVAVVSTPPGGLDFAAAEEPGQEYAPESWLSSALAAMFLRGNATNTAVVGSVHTLAVPRRYWCGGATSAGVWSQLAAQFIPPGDLAELVDAEASRGGGRFRYHYDHTYGHMSGAIGQNALWPFGEYVVSTGGATTYVSNGTNNAGAVTLGVSGDSVTLRRHNRLLVVTTSSYTVNGAQSTGTNALAVSGSSTPIPAGCLVRVVASDTNTYEFVVGADFAGGAGSIDARDWSPGGTVTINNGAAISVVQHFAVRTDYAGGAGSVQVWPSIQFPIAASSPIELQHPAGEGYGEDSWAVGYCGTKSMGRVWRSDHSSGRGVPLQEKLDASVERLVRAGNPRALELNLMLFGSPGDSLQRVDSLVHERSFWLRSNLAVPVPLAERSDLHDEGDMAKLAHLLYTLRLAAGVNVAGVHAYLGGRRSNPSGTAAAVPWLKGRNAAHTPQVLKTFLTDPTRFGGAFA